MREFVRQLAESLREDTTWSLDKYWAVNDKLGVKIWVANGLPATHVEWAATRRSYGSWADEVKVGLSLREKFVLWGACIALRKRKRETIYDEVLQSIIARRLNADK